MDQNTSRGLAAVRRIKRQHNLDGAYGTLAELVDVHERYRQAVEVTAGQSLFHYVVDTDDTASKIIQILQKERSGRITFMPLNRLRPRTANVPKASDAIPMIEKLQFDPRYENAFKQVFGQTVICPNLQIAGQYARSHSVNGVTMDGDRSDRKGAFTGGSSDTRHSRLQAVRNVAKWRDECDTHKARSTEIKRTLEKKDQEITRAVGNLQKIEQKRVQQENSYGPLRQELRSKSNDIQNKKDLLDAKYRANSKIEANMKALSDQQSAHEAELSSDFKKVLTQTEETQLENLNATVLSLRGQHNEVSNDRSGLQSRKLILDIELRENLRPRLDNLSARDLESGSAAGSSISSSRADLKRITSVLTTTETNLARTTQEIETIQAQIAEHETRHGNTKSALDAITTAMAKSQKQMEKSIRKRRILNQQAAEVALRLRDLGILPQANIQKFQNMKSEAIVKRLHKTNEALKKYGHVNKKAFEQYQNFTSQKETLIKRRGELESNQASIEELIQVLDQRKDEAIERTFRQVSREFKLVFEKLVPAGVGRLVIQRKIDTPGEDVSSDDEQGEGQGKEKGRVENYTGVGISVSFNSKHDEQQRIGQLSGGQKSKP